MAKVKGPQFYLDNSLNSEKLILDTFDIDQQGSRGAKSALLIRLLCAGLFMEKVNPAAVDVMVGELNRGNEPDWKVVERAIEAFGDLPIKNQLVENKPKTTHKHDNTADDTGFDNLSVS